MRKKVLFFFVLTISIVNAQQSFVKEFSTETHEFYPPYVATDILQPNSLAFLTPLNEESHTFLLETNSFGEFQSGFEIYSPYALSHGHPIPLSFSKNRNQYAFNFNLTRGFELKNALIFIDSETGFSWAKKAASFYFYQFCFLSRSQRVIGTYETTLNTGENINGIYSIEASSGTCQWSYAYKNRDALNWDYITLSAGAESPNGFIYFLVRWNNSSNSFHGVIKINHEGEIIQAINLSFPSVTIGPYVKPSISFDSEGNLLIPFQINISEEDEPAKYEGALVKIDSDLSLLWAKQIHADGFYTVDLNASLFPDGRTIFINSTGGRFPNIRGVLDADGNLISKDGFSFGGNIAIEGNGSVCFTSNTKYYEDGSTTPGFIVAKSNPDGEIDVCPQFDACVEVFDLDVQIEESFWERAPVAPPESIPIEVRPYTFTTQDYCGTPPPPTADFMLPDTICQYECLVPDSTNNRYAHHVEWHITGESTDTIIADTTFTWCFEEAGTYFIEQEIWLLGCSEVYLHRLTVLPDNLAPPLGEDRTICDELPVELIPASSRPLKSFLWDDGAQTESRLLTTSGTYYLTATDGYCSIEDTVTLNVLQETIHPPFLDIPNDTLLCPDLLPLTLYPTSIYTDTFFLNDGTSPSNKINIYEAGDHSIWASIEGCLFEENIHVEIESCKVPVFLPNAFSPNDDGINDFLYLLGEDFDPVKIQVFDRWGGLIYASDVPPISWDGNAAGKEVDTGVYLISFTYFNKRNQREELFSKDVLLVR